MRRSTKAENNAVVVPIGLQLCHRRIAHGAGYPKIFPTRLRLKWDEKYALHAVNYQ